MYRAKVGGKVHDPTWLYIYIYIRCMKENKDLTAFLT